MILDCITFELSTLDWGAVGATASAVMIVVTGYSIISSNRQNKKNRIIQLNTIIYQTKIEWINQLKTAINQVLAAIDETIVRDFFSQFRVNSKHQDFSKIYFSAEEKLKTASFSLETVLLGCEATVEKEFMKIFRDFKFRYQLYIDDVIFLLQFPNNFKNPEKIPNTEFFKKELLKYKSHSLKKENGNPERIWEIAEKYDYQLISKRDEILQELFRWADSHFFKIKCKELLYAEYKIAERILTNGTKQDK